MDTVAVQEKPWTIPDDWARLMGRRYRSISSWEDFMSQIDLLHVWKVNNLQREYECRDGWHSVLGICTEEREHFIRIPGLPEKNGVHGRLLTLYSDFLLEGISIE
jgi:hypothetical protein